MSPMGMLGLRKKPGRVRRALAVWASFEKVTVEIIALSPTGVKGSTSVIGTGALWGREVCLSQFLSSYHHAGRRR